MSFSDIAVRANGDRIINDWFNALRTAGAALESTFGGGFVADTAWTFNNTVAAGSPVAVTPLVFDKTVCKSAWCKIAVRRSTASNQIRAQVELFVDYDDLNTTWIVSDVVEHGQQVSGLTFTINASGQVFYSSNTVSGSSYSGASRVKAETFGL